MCCNEGEQWGVDEKHCSLFDNRVDVADELQGLCLSTVEICCSKQHQIFQCTAGQIAAKNGLSCLSQNSSTTGSDFFKVGSLQSDCNILCVMQYICKVML